MAVPKKKRYKQVVKSRRSLQKINTILNKHLTITKFNNYANIFTTNEGFSCVSCKNDLPKNSLCGSCYVSYFVNFFEKKRPIQRKENMNNDIFHYNFYDELSKTFFPFSGA